MTETLRIATDALRAISKDDQPGRLTNPDQFDFYQAYNALLAIKKRPPPEMTGERESIAIAALTEIESKAPRSVVVDPLMPMRVAREALRKIDTA